MIEYGAVVAGSFLASAHCIGMCGGLAVAVGATQRSTWPLIERQLIYTAGRVFTYSFLGAVGGLAGRSLARLDTTFVSVQQAFSFIAGVAMVFVGLSSLGWLPTRRIGGLSVLSSAWSSLFQQFLNARGRFGHFIAGIATGFLPCGLVYAFLAMAVARADAINGMLWMAAFGIGTAPAMVTIGCGGSLLSRTARIGMLRTAGCAMILMGGVSIYRAVPKEAPCCEPNHFDAASLSGSTGGK
ncbi:MAG: sulfite exporter TauE/SafE family protein [Phycisphaerae bacterium]|nr:sulfite exporter TauE/SafE family protein [Phycisphaerae bacterium]